ncbi:MAG: protein-L-isoaspartate O-methyltransferase family protein [Rhodospirillales bacterium]
MDFAAARHNMVESQIRPNRVTDERLIAAMATVPREAFVPKELRGVAYVDEAIPVGDGRYLMEPMVVARLMQEAAPTAGDLALTIGCGTGYAAAVLSHLVGAVVAVESDAALARQASQTLTGMGIDTVAVIEGVLADGCRDQAPFDVIFFDGAVAEIPESVSSQLAEGGRLVAIVAGNGVGKGMLATRRRGILTTREIFDAGTPLLPGFERKAVFIF